MLHADLQAQCVSWLHMRNSFSYAEIERAQKLEDAVAEDAADLDTRPALPAEAPPELEPAPEPESELPLSRLPLLLLLSSSSSSPRPAEAAPSFWAIGANLPPPPDCMQDYCFRKLSSIKGSQQT